MSGEVVDEGEHVETHPEEGKRSVLQDSAEQTKTTHEGEMHRDELGEKA